MLILSHENLKINEANKRGSVLFIQSLLIKNQWYENYILTSNRSNSMTLDQAATKSFTNLSFASSVA